MWSANPIGIINICITEGLPRFFSLIFLENSIFYDIKFGFGIWNWNSKDNQKELWKPDFQICELILIFSFFLILSLFWNCTFWYDFWEFLSFFIDIMSKANRFFFFMLFFQGRSWKMWRKNPLKILKKCWCFPKGFVENNGFFRK